MTVAEIWSAVEAAVSTEALFADVEGIWRHDRWFSYDRFGKSCAYCVERMVEAGFDQAEVIPFPADGKTIYGDVPMPLAWDAEDAELHVIEPDGTETLIASYRDTPQNLMMYSNPTPPDGVEAGIVYIENGSDPAAYDERSVRGKIVFSSGPLSELIPLAAAYGAVGVVSDYMKLVPGISDRRSQRSAVGWINDGFNTLGTRGKDGLNIFGFILSPKTGDRLRLRLKENPRLRLKARVNARLYEGSLNVATGLVPGAETEEEIFLTGHLYEPGAGDNASGVAAFLEAGRVLARLIETGMLPRPKRGIRFVFGQEITGLSAWLYKNRDRLRSIVAGLNLDDIGHKPGSGSRLSVHGLHDACPSFVGYLADDLARKMKDLVPHLHVETGMDFEQYDNHGCDPMVGAPTPVLAGSRKAFYHTSLDTPDTLDPTSLAAHATLAATYAYTLASAGLAETVELARLGMDPASRRIQHRADERMERIRAAGLKHAGARHLPDAVTFYGDVEIEGLVALRGLVPEKDRPAFDKSTAHIVRQLKETTATKRREAETLAAVLPRNEADEVLADGERLVPRRATFGLLTLESLPDEDRRAMKADKDLRMGVWGSVQNILFWCDGKRTIREIAIIIGHSTGAYNVAATLKRMRFLERNGYLKLSTSLDTTHER